MDKLPKEICDEFKEEEKNTEQIFNELMKDYKINDENIKNPTQEEVKIIKQIQKLKNEVLYKKGAIDKYC